MGVCQTINEHKLANLDRPSIQAGAVPFGADKLNAAVSQVQLNLAGLRHQDNNIISLAPNNPTSPCTNLRELHCVDYDYQLKDMFLSEPSPSMVDQTRKTRNALLLVETNPKLRTLTLEHNELSLPVGLRDLEFRYSYAQIDSSDWGESNIATTLKSKVTTTPLPALERLCLRGPQNRVTSHWQEEVFIPSPFIHVWDPLRFNYFNPEVTTLIKRAPRLRDLVLRDYCGNLQDVLQLLVSSCLELETIDLSNTGIIEQNDEHIDMVATTAGPLSPGSCFAKLKKFRIEGEWSSSTHQAIAELVSRSTDTLEIAWFDCCSWRPITYPAIPFHIGTDTSWTRCIRLKELVLYQQRGFSMSDYRWNAPDHSRTILDAVEEDYSTVFSRLEKLSLCPCEDTEDDIRDRKLKQATRRKKWEHRLAFILQVRELYGRLKDLKQLRALEIEWRTCPLIHKMTLEDILRLFYETEFDEDKARGINLKRREDLTRTSKGWWGPITTADLRWLCLSWPTQAELDARSKIQQLASIALKNSKVEFNTSYARLADPFQRRVGRIWEDWMYLVGSCPHHWCDRPRHEDDHLHPCCCRMSHWSRVGFLGSSRTAKFDAAIDGYEALCSDHVVYSREFESLSGGMIAERGGRWRNRKANRSRF
ncbi:MAG: hypothetical protein JOS17DRAFT_773098 [Linnemannia elongata]|nr:MAG: hypothetical protein JOS17DRAFT_773098 [Linnemannia elongata]